MYEFKVKRSSWHYKVAELFGWKEHVLYGDVDDDYTYRKNDFCSYAAHVVLPLIVIVAFTMFLGVMLFANFRYLSVWVDGLLRGAWVDGFTYKDGIVRVGFIASIFALAPYLGAGLVIGIGRLTIRLEQCKAKQVESENDPYPAPKEPGFAFHLHESIKKRVCFKVKVID